MERAAAKRCWPFPGSATNRPLAPHKTPAMDHAASSPPRPSPALPFTAANGTQLSVTGRPCQFPALYEGELVTDCIPIAGLASCQVGRGTNAWWHGMVGLVGGGRCTT